MRTHWTFRKNGKVYSAGGKNRFEAQLQIELMFQIDLTGATFEEIFGTITVRTGKVR